MPGEPSPFVSALTFFTKTFPSPRSVAKAAQCAPVVVIFRFSPIIVPPYVASRPREEFFFVTISVFLTVTFAFSPHANTALEPEASVVIFPLSIDREEFAHAATAEFSE